MEREVPINSVENNTQQIKDVVEKNYAEITHFLATNAESYPRCCSAACKILQSVIKKECEIELKICEGTFTNILKEEQCDYHVWLEYKNLIIDPTDYQFQVVDLWSLPLMVDNMLPKDRQTDNLSQKYSEQLMMDIYMQNAYQRYIENPNEKEKYFLELKNLLKDNHLPTGIFIDELKRCFGAKTFYNKNDTNYRYRTFY